MEEDLIDWDDDNPPTLGEERIQRELCKIVSFDITYILSRILWKPRCL